MSLLKAMALDLGSFFDYIFHFLKLLFFLLLVWQEASRVAQPVLLGFLIGHISEPHFEKTTAYLYGFGLGSLLFLHVAFSTVYIFLQNHVALKMKTGLEALIYRKIISLSSEAALQTSPAMVTEQLSIDTSIFLGVSTSVLELTCYYFLNNMNKNKFYCVCTLFKVRKPWHR